eukprot:scaffold65018_cov32-Attheya_sp.AAC.1
MLEGKEFLWTNMESVVANSEQWRKGGSLGYYAQTTFRTSTVVDKDGKVIKARPTSYASAVEPLEALTAWIVSQLKSSSGSTVGLSIPALTALMSSPEIAAFYSLHLAGGIKYLSRQRPAVHRSRHYRRCQCSV